MCGGDSKLTIRFRILFCAWPKPFVFKVNRSIFRFPEVSVNWFWYCWISRISDQEIRNHSFSFALHLSCCEVILAWPGGTCTYQTSCRFFSDSCSSWFFRFHWCISHLCDIFSYYCFIHAVHLFVVHAHPLLAIHPSHLPDPRYPPLFAGSQPLLRSPPQPPDSSSASWTWGGYLLLGRHLRFSSFLR